MQQLARNGYTSDQVKYALHHARTMAFRYDLLDGQNNFKRSLTNMLTANVANNSANEIKRTARFTLVEDGTINYLSDRIQPWARVKMPDGSFAEFALGVFLLSTPKRKDNGDGTVQREIEAYDQLQVLKDDAYDTRYAVLTGANAIAEVKKVLTGAGIALMNLTPCTSTLPTDWEWEPGISKLKIINDLLSAINYRTLWFDELGYAMAVPNVTADLRASEYAYADDSLSVMYAGVEHTLDLFSVPNKVILVVSESDMLPMSSTYTNSNPNSPTSTVSRGRTVVQPPQQVQALDQASLDAMARQAMFDASQVAEQYVFETAIMPMHSDSDVITLNYSRLNVSGKFLETAWSFDLVPNGRMKHTVQRVVAV